MATLREPGAVAVDAEGNVYIADTENNAVRRIDAQTQTISLVAGTGMPGYSGDNGPAGNAMLCAPRGLAFDTAQNLLIADSCNDAIRQVDAGGTITTIAGTGPGVRNTSVGGSVGDGGPASVATLADPTGLTVDGAGNIYVTDTGNQRVRRINGASHVISTVAGNGTAGYTNDGGLAAQAELNGPEGIAVDRTGAVYIADTGNNVIRRVDPASGKITTYAGGAAVSGGDTLGDGGPALSAVLNSPSGLAIDSTGSLYIADSGDDLIRKVDPSTGVITIVAGIDPIRWKTITSTEPPLTLSGDGSALDADILSPLSIAFGANNVLYIADTGNDVVRSIDLSTPFLSFLTGSSAVLTLTNSTGGTLNFASPTVAGANQSNFTISSNTCNQALSAGASCQVQISFTGASAGTQQASLALSTTDGTIAAGVTMEALGEMSGQLVVSPAVLTMTAAPGQTSASSTVSITNATGAATSVGMPMLVGAGASQFLINSSNCPAVLESSGSCSLSVLFVPAASGSYTAGISIPGAATTVDLSGFAVSSTTGSAPAPTPITPAPPTGQPLQFVPVEPCRVADTRSSAGALGGPIVAAGATRTFDIPQSACNIPANAAAYSLNVTALPMKGLNYLSIWPAGEPKPYVSTLNSDGRIKANAVIVGAGLSGGVSVYVSDASHVVLDIDGYFVPAGSAAAGLDFYPVTPCRLVDTRSAAASLAGPSLDDNETRSFPLLAGACNLPSSAQAYSLNFTVVPHGAFGYLSVWPTGHDQPFVSTLNAFTGTVTSNAAIVPAGTNGDVSVFVTDETDLIIDVNGYFASPGANGLSLYTITPCRVLDTRSNGGKPFNGKIAIPVETSSCALPPTASAYVANATLLAPQPVNFLALWPDGDPQPLVSTLNSFDAATTSNMAIVPVSNGAVDAYVSQPGHLIFDISGYFAP
ncbi:MAG TPA: choice-of-anchor D domain-containing protein [Bryobacteraceae bacterium]|nr:choice-of-anchor D domain-containing protein [Bryobacteraceae bacterium]